jgi:hypothetical protein
MKKVSEEKTILTEELKKLLPKIDFHDTFSTSNRKDSLQEITNLVFNTTPKWVEVLFHIRNKIMAWFGLNMKKPADYNEEYKVGGYVQFFKIFSIDENKVILGADDSHLNFRAVILKDESLVNNIKVITLVEYNNWKGKVYMSIIKPFHRLVVKNMVKNAYAN